MVSEKAPLTPGNRLPLKLIPVGTFVYNVEIKQNGGAKIGRSAGIFAQVVANADGYTNLKMPSTEVRKVSEKCWATIGEVSNSEYKLQNYGKAGKSRWRGIRPTVRGTAMNPVDHPHGGGEGKTGEGMHPVDPWGNLTKGYRTRNNKRTQVMIVSRRKK